MKNFRNKSDLPAIVRTTVADHKMIESGSGVIVGLSGGPDSVVLIHVLHHLSADGDFWIAAAHLDHGLRPESPFDAACAVEITEKLGIPIRVRKADVRALAKSQGISVEEAGRRIRYSFFEETRIALGASAIATAHHADDQIETFLLRIFRGSSLQGLGGIPPVRERIIRPLARVTRKEILRYATEHNLEYRTDDTNLDLGTDRNFIRNRLIPIIEERFPGFRNPIGRTVELIRQEEQFLNDLASELATASISRDRDGLIVSVLGLRAASSVLASRVLLLALYEVSGPEVRWGRIHVESALALLHASNPSARITLPNRIELIRDYDKLRIRVKTPGETSPPLDMIVFGPCSVEIPKTRMVLLFRAFEVQYEPELPKEPTTEWFDADRLPFPLRVRNPLPGDRIRPLGMQGSRKVKKVLIDAKIPVDVRKTLPLVLRGDEIVWVPGIRRSRTASIKPSTRRVLEMKLISADDSSRRTGSPSA